MENQEKKDREGKKLVRIIKEYQGELNARDLIRSFPISSDNSRPKSNSSSSIFMISIIAIVLITGFVSIQLMTNKNEQKTVNSSDSNSPSLPSLPIYSK